MNDNSNVVVKIVGDASGVAPAVDIAKGSIGGLEGVVAQMSTTMAALTQEMQAGFAKIAAGSTEAFGGMGIAAQAGAAKVAESAGVVTLASERIVAAGEMAKTKWEAVGAGFSKINAAMIGVMAVLAGGEIFKSTIEATTKLTAENRNLARALGVTLEKASGVHSAMTKLGIGVDQVVAASQKMVRQLKAHEDQFIKVGIATRDSNGHFLSTLDILTNGLGTLRKYKEGVDQTAVAQMMFGRGAGDLTALLRLNNAEIEEGARVAKELGLVTTSEGVEAMHKYKDATREVGEVMEGMKVAIGNALLPVLTELATWMRGHGAQAIKYLKDTLIDLIDTFKETVLEVRFMIANVTLWLTHFLGFAEGVKMTAEIIGASIKMMAKIAFDALHFNWGDIEADWSAGMASIDAIATRHLGHIAGEAAKAQAALAMVATQLANVRNHKNKDQDELGSPLDLYASGQFQRPDAGGAMREDDISGKKGKKEKTKKEKAPKDDLMQTLNDELDVMKASWEAKQILQGTAQAFSLESEAAFWDKAKARANLSAKDRLEIDKKWITAHQAIQKQTIAEQLEVYKSDIEEAGRNWTEKLAILSAESAYVSSMYGAQSKEAQVARDAVIKAKREEAAQIRALQTQIAKGEEDAALATVDAAQSAANFEVEMGRASKGQLLAQEKTFEDQRYQIKRAALLEQIELAKLDPNNDQAKLEAMHLQVEALERTHQSTLTGIDRQATLERTSLMRTAVDSVATSWGSSIAKMVTLQASFATTVKSMWKGIVGAAESAIGSIVKGFLKGLLQQAAGSKAFHAREVLQDAKRAASGAYAAIAKIPYVGPFLAPAAAAVAFAGVMAFSAEGGYDVPGGGGGGMDGRGGMMGIVHPGEMILPRQLADTVRNGAANQNTPGGGGGLNVTINAMDSQSVRRLFMDNKGHLAEAVRKYARDGGR